MRRSALRAALSVVAFGVLAGAPLAQPATPPAASGPPPIIDRELFFGDPEISGAQISPDGKYLSFPGMPEGKAQLERQSP